MLHGFTKPTHNAASNKMSYQTTFNILCWFLILHPSRLIPEVPYLKGTFSMMPIPCSIVRYSPDSTTLQRRCNPEFQIAKAHSDVTFDKRWTAHTPSQHESIEINMFGLPQVEGHVKEIVNGDKPLQGQDNQPTQLYNVHCQHLCQEDQTIQHTAAQA